MGAQPSGGPEGTHRVRFVIVVFLAKQLRHIEVQTRTPARLYQAAAPRPTDREIL